MRYQNVYGKGPLDDREPLYHSEPFWIEVDSHPGYRSQVSTFIDNYSHICVDVGVKDAGAIRVATRFNAFIDNVELLQARKDRSRLMVDPVEASQDEEELTSREVKVISQNLDVG